MLKYETLHVLHLKQVKQVKQTLHVVPREGVRIMATVRLAPVLRPSVGGAKQVNALGSNLAEVLADLYSRYPSLKEQIQQEESLSRFINVYVNDQDVRFLQGLETGVGPNDTVILLPAMAGGR